MLILTRNLRKYSELLNTYFIDIFFFKLRLFLQFFNGRIFEVVTRIIDTSNDPMIVIINHHRQVVQIVARGETPCVTTGAGGQVRNRVESAVAKLSTR